MQSKSEKLLLQLLGVYKKNSEHNLGCLGLLLVLGLLLGAGRTLDVKVIHNVSFGSILKLVKFFCRC